MVFCFYDNNWNMESVDVVVYFLGIFAPSSPFLASGFLFRI